MITTYFRSESYVGPALLLILATLIWAVFPRTSSGRKYLNSLPWVGRHNEWLADFRGGIRFVKKSRALFAEGYAKYSKKNLAFVVPQMLSPPLLALPPHRVKEIASLPNDIVDTEDIARELIAADHLYPIGRGDNIHMDIVRKYLTRILPVLAPSVYEELVLGMQEWWPTEDQEWRSVKLYPTCTNIISRAAIRAFAGESLCRTPEFVEASYQYTEAAFAAGPLIGLAPRILQPVVAPIVATLCRVNYHFNIAKHFALPVIQERIAAVRADKYTDKTGRPDDLLQLLVEAIIPLAREKPHQLKDDVLVARVLGLNMAAIHTTSITMTNTISHLYSSPDRDTFISGLRDEVKSVLSENGGLYNMKAVASLHRIDSAIRESMRCNLLTDDSLRREVTAKKGLELPGGLFIPRGIRTVIPAHAVHRDKDIYGPDAEKFDPFRFSRPYEAQHQASEIAPGHKDTPMTTTSENFLSFGHGRHACPGRFFASMEMKLMLAHIVMHYDMEIPEPIPNQTFANFDFPSGEQLVKIRRFVERED